MSRAPQARAVATRQALVAAARELFVEHGYAGTGTPQICEATGMTRGALYHHFADKRELFRAVLLEESARVAEAIRAAAPEGLPPREALQRGALAYLDAMAVAGCTRLLLVEGPTVLGPHEMRAMDAAHAGATLAEGLAAALPAHKRSLPFVVSLLSAAFDRAALDIALGAPRKGVEEAICGLIGAVLDAAAKKGASPRAR